MRSFITTFLNWLRAILFAACALTLFFMPLANFPSARAVSPDLVIYEVYGGGGNSGAPYTNDFIVLFNRGAGSVSTSGKSIQYTSATGTGLFSANRFVLPAATIAPGQYFLIQFSGGAVGAPLPAPDASGSITMGASAGKVVLVNSASGLDCNGGSTLCNAGQLALIIDLVGYGNANFFEGVGAAPTISNTTADARLGSGCTETDNNNSDFQALAPEPRNTASVLNQCATGDSAPYIAATVPGANASGVALDANLSITFSEPVNTAGDWYAISCPLSGIHSAVVTGGPSTFALNPDIDFTAGETCTATIFAAQVSDQDANDPPDTMAANASWSFATVGIQAHIHQIQGAGHISPLTGQPVSDVPGIVTARAANGFYMQDPNPDSDAATSEAIFVYTGSAPTVQAGDSVAVDGTVSEYRPGSDSTNLTVTELTAPTITVLSSGNALPAAVVIGTGGRFPPDIVIEDDVIGSVEAGGTFDPASDGLDFYESLEAMHVQVNDAVAVGPANSFGEVPVVGDNGANAGLRTPRGGLVVRANDFNPERIFLDDEILKSLSPAQVMPVIVTGDHIPGGVVGVIDYSYGLYKLQVTQAPPVTSGGLTREVAQQPGMSQLVVATFNAEDLSAADGQERFDRLAGLIINNLRSPDVLALEEIQDNNGATNDSTVEADQTLSRLVSAIQNLGGPLYSFRQINPVDDQDGGQPGGNIRVAFLFRADRGLSFVDRPAGSSTTANTVISDGSGVHLQYSPGRLDPANAAFADSRKPLAGEFLYHSHRVFVIANHFNSKGGDQPLFGRYQPPALSSETQRIQQAQVVHGFVQSLLAADAQASVIVLGDLNDFQFSNPLAALKGSPAILSALIETLPEAERYTYIYEGNAQALDHILVSSALAGRSLVYDSVHVNCEFIDQASDHDPQLLILSLPYPFEIRLPVIVR